MHIAHRGGQHSVTSFITISISSNFDLRLATLIRITVNDLSLEKLKRFVVIIRRVLIKIQGRIIKLFFTVMIL